MADNRQRVVLQKLFKDFTEQIKSNKDFRNALNKEANHYLTEDIAAIKSQVKTIGSTLEKKFNANYEKALTTLANSNLSDLTFIQIQKTLKERFLGNFTELHKLGIDIGHVTSNLTIASNTKLQDSVFNNTSNFSEYSNTGNLTDEDYRNISKTVAFLNVYQDTLAKIDNIQDRAQLIKFLKTSKSFSRYARESNLNTLDDIRKVLTTMTDGKNSGFADLGRDILNESTLNITANTTLDIKRKIFATSSGVEVTFEVRAFNQFKGTLANSIKNAMLSNMDKLLGGNKLAPHIDKALTNSIISVMTKQEFLQVFPNVTASKSMVEAVESIIVETIEKGKTSNYSSSKLLPSTTISNTVSLKIPKVKLDKIKVPKLQVPKIRNQQGQFTSLASIQNILNQNINEQVVKNMGNRGALNYRTGRFSNSVKIDRLQMQRDGAIGIFYSYMKYPYQTFEPGFAQGSIARDPRVLITKSIREIATGLVTNRLRVTRV